jgi:hypothetical protein
MKQIDEVLFEVLADLYERSGATREEALLKANTEMTDMRNKAAIKRQAAS